MPPSPFSPPPMMAKSNPTPFFFFSRRADVTLQVSTCGLTAGMLPLALYLRKACPDPSLEGAAAAAADAGLILARTPAGAAPCATLVFDIYKHRTDFAKFWVRLRTFSLTLCVFNAREGM